MIKSATISNNSVPVTPLPPNTHTLVFFKGLYNEGQAKVQDLQWQYDELEPAHQAGMRNWWVGETRVGQPPALQLACIPLSFQPIVFFLPVTRSEVARLTSLLDEQAVVYAREQVCHDVCDWMGRA